MNYQRPPPEIAALFLAGQTPDVLVESSGRWLLFLEKASHISIEELGHGHVAVAGLEFDPRTGRSAHHEVIAAMQLMSVLDKTQRPITGLPPEARVSHAIFSPDGERLAFGVTREDRVELWVADCRDAGARRLMTERVCAVLPGPAYEWLPDGRGLLVALATSESYTPPSEEAPTGPRVQTSGAAGKAVRPTLGGLRDERQTRYFEKICSSSAAIVSLDGTVRRVGEPTLCTELSVSPDGRYLLRESLQPPYSQLDHYDTFPTRVEILDMAGAVVRRIADLPNADSLTQGRHSVMQGPRQAHWRSDVPATVCWVEAQDGGDALASAAIRDQLFDLAAPFQDQPRPGIALPLRLASIQWFSGSLAVVTESWLPTRREIISWFAPDDLTNRKTLMFDRSVETGFDDPGTFMETHNAAGRPILLSADGGAHLMLQGAGVSPDGVFPFLESYEVATGRHERLWQSGAHAFEVPFKVLDPRHLCFIASKETPREAPELFLHHPAGATQRLTSFGSKHSLAMTQKKLIKYTRADGLELGATLYLPYADDAKNRDLPLLMWLYPEDFLDPEAPEQATESSQLFVRLPPQSPLYWLARGYAVFDNPMLPIIGGAGGQGDSWVTQIVSGAQAAIDAVVASGLVNRHRVAVGGHSFGAFIAVNLLAHSKLFAAGIAQSGAYNRTLTPFGFQFEERSLWEARSHYLAVSPLLYADRIKAPLLLIHGAEDRTTTQPAQSENLFAALRALGATARLCVLPHEGHQYRAHESLLHVLWEMDAWLSAHVGPRAP